MKSIICALVLVLCVVPFAFGKTAQVDFGFDQNAEQTIDGYRIYERVTDGKLEMTTVLDPTVRSIDFELVGEITDCRTYFMTSIKNGIDSNPSNTAALCADMVLPDMIVKPGTTVNFTINVLND